jgi:putative tricarboxylic transport membrane protein
MDILLHSLEVILQPGTLLFLGIGVIAGLIIGVIPGLGGTAAVALMMPFIFVLDTHEAMALIIGAVAVVHHSDAIASVLLGIPGSSSAAVLLLDGHEMTKQGKGANALSIAFLASMFGGLIGAVGLTVSIPVARPLVLIFGSPEIFVLTVIGISLTALLSKGNMLKGLLAGAFGVLLGQVGAAPASPDYRFTFDSLALSSGLDLVAVALSVFGIAEVIHLVAKKSSVSKDQGQSLSGGWLDGIREFFQNFWHVVRGAFIGIWAGVLPGVGATAGTWMAYGQAQATAKKGKGNKFGKGDARGIIAPESAANSVEAGDLIPTLLFGIPGAAPAALLLGALLVFGIEPGPRILTDHLDVIYVIVWSFGIASIFGSVLSFFIAGPLSKLSYIRFPILAGALVPILFMAGYQGSHQIVMLVLMLVLGIIGWLMKELDFPRPPFLIGFVLSIPMERYYYLTDNLYSFTEWVTRPGVLILSLILILPLIWNTYKWLRRMFSKTKTESTDTEISAKIGEDNAPRIWSLAFMIGLAVLFGAAFIANQQYAEAARLMPNVVTVIGFALSLVGIVSESRKMAASDKYARLHGSEDWRQTLRSTLVAGAWLLLFVILNYIFGMVIAIVLFLPVFLFFVARLKWWIIAIYTVVLAAVMYILEAYLGIVLPTGYIYLGI